MDSRASRRNQSACACSSRPAGVKESSSLCSYVNATATDPRGRDQYDPFDDGAILPSDPDP
jgi:hypothetical protein